MPSKTSGKANVAPQTVRASNRLPALKRQSKPTPGPGHEALSKNDFSGESQSAGTDKPSLKPLHSKVKKYSVTMPKCEHDAVVALKEKLRAQGIKVKKSELIRVGIRQFLGLSDARIKASLTKMASG